MLTTHLYFQETSKGSSLECHGLTYQCQSFQRLVVESLGSHLVFPDKKMEILVGDTIVGTYLTIYIIYGNSI